MCVRPSLELDWLLTTTSTSLVDWIGWLVVGWIGWLVVGWWLVGDHNAPTSRPRHPLTTGSPNKQYTTTTTAHTHTHTHNQTNNKSESTNQYTHTTHTQHTHTHTRNSPSLYIYYWLAGLATITRPLRAHITLLRRVHYVSYLS